MALLMILILFKKMCNKKSIIIFSSHVRNKILFNKKLSDFFKTLLHYYQIPYPKNIKIWAKLDNLLVNKIFIYILILFFWITPTLCQFSTKNLIGHKLWNISNFGYCTKSNFQVFCFLIVENWHCQGHKKKRPLHWS